MAKPKIAVIISTTRATRFGVERLGAAGSMPAVLKNALDYAYPEWNRKAAAYVGYGSVGAARSIEHLRLACVELQMAPMRHGVHLQGADFMAALQQGKDIKEFSYLEPNSKAMLDELHWWTSVLMAARKSAV
jgi:NAD(P)H-dependent FMN reductase